MASHTVKRQSIRLRLIQALMAYPPAPYILPTGLIPWLPPHSLLVNAFLCGVCRNTERPVDEERQRLSLAPGIHSWTTSTAREHLERVLGWSSPLTNTALIKLFLLIMESPFIRAHEMEPTIDSQDGQALLKQVQCLPDCPRNLFDLSESSVLTLFAAHPIFRCLICGNPKQSMTRVTGCIRSHLDHRPYACHGDAGCETCPKDRV